MVEYRKISLPRDVVDRAEKIRLAIPQLGLRSIAEIVKRALDEYLTELEVKYGLVGTEIPRGAVAGKR